MSSQRTVARWWPMVAQCLTLLALAGIVVVTTHQDRWELWPLVTIVAYVILSEATAVVHLSMRVYISGSMLGIVLAAIVLGGGPGAVIGVLSAAFGWLRSRERGHMFRHNLIVFAGFPLATGLAFHATVRLAHLNDDVLGYYVCVFAAFVLALTLNFVGYALGQAGRDGMSFRTRVRDVFLPVLAAELFSALMTVAAVYVAIHLGTMGIIMFALVLGIFQYLVGELLRSKSRSDKLQRIATTDELTGLGNRVQFHAMIAKRIAAADEAPRSFAVLLMDLDRFKEINDTLGHHYGDVLLKEFGPRLTDAIGEGGFVARLGGDEFGILLAEDTDDTAVLDVVMARLFKSVSQPFMIDELSLEVGASVGVARFPQDGEDSHALLRCADIAMYAAKETQTEFKIYTADQNQHSKRRLGVLSGIRHALVQDEIVVHYQPIIDLAEGRVRGAEGLVRWQHPEHGLIPPGAFVQTVEQTGLIGPLTRHVLERSIAECAAWRTDGREMSVAVNLSVRNLLDHDLPKEIERLLSKYGLPPEALQLEITESMIMSDPERALGTVSRLSRLGARLSVDDFGTGYSSLANLRKMPIDELKIDRSFVSPMLRNESDLIIVRSTINLGHDLGLNVIAEGVEDSPTLAHLGVLGCDLAQGYHVSKPMAADAFTDWLSETPRQPAKGDPQKASQAKAAPTSVTRGAVDLGGLTFAAPEQ
ncbi:MAG TPA: EAL domain-containing protein [Solirubrobacteraceae bacterium]|jgi:diguanylate cyclase (GGDEF)-like protein|nr:EAL domain-containing protein [Solirubrobacteraceae bacterium]